MKSLIGCNIILRRENYKKITVLLEKIDSIKCINSFIGEENISKNLVNIERVIGSGVNGEVLSIKLTGHDELIAVKTIPITKTDHDHIIKYIDGNINIVYALAEIKALDICTQYVLTNKSPHFNIMYKYLLCKNCQYFDIKVQEKTFIDYVDPLCKDILDKIKKDNAIKEGNHINRCYKIKDIQEYNKKSKKVISQYCVYIFNERANGDMQYLLNCDLTFNNLKIYLFQIFSALNLCYIENEMSHHDLHCKNILFVNDEYKDVDHDLYNIIIENDDKTETKTIPVKLPLNGKMLRIWDFGRVNIQGKIHIISSPYFRENKKVRFMKDVEKIFNDAQLGLKNNPIIRSNDDFIKFIDEIIKKYNENGYFSLMNYLIEKINEINTTCNSERFRYNF